MRCHASDWCCRGLQVGSTTLFFPDVLQRLVHNGAPRRLPHCVVLLAYSKVNS
jgi:hypothetical protein